MVIYLLVDDTKLGGRVSCKEDGDTLQENLDRLSEWHKKRLMEPSVKRYEVINLIRNQIIFEKCCNQVLCWCT